MATGSVVKVSGPLVVAEGLADANMYDVVRVGPQRLIGEIIEMRGDNASIQVYEETSGLGPGASVETTGFPLSVELGPGMIENIYDGIQRPLEKIMAICGNTIQRGIEVSPIDHEKKWDFVPKVQAGDYVVGGDILGTVQETTVMEHRIMVPYGTEGSVREIKSGAFNVLETICVLEKDGKTVELPMMQRWAVRNGRPYKTKLSPETPLCSGQRVIDTMVPCGQRRYRLCPWSLRLR